jgi:hypothetical protein
MFIAKHDLFIPTEIIFIILSFVDKISMRQLLKVDVFKEYRGEIKKYIEQYDSGNVEYWNNVYYGFIKPKIVYEIDNHKLGLYTDSERWSQIMIDCVSDCLYYDTQNLKHIEDNENIDKIMVYNMIASQQLDIDYCKNNIFKTKLDIMCKPDYYSIKYSIKFI